MLPGMAYIITYAQVGPAECVSGCVSVGAVYAREKRKSDQAGLVQPVFECSQVLQLPYSTISWRWLKSRDHSTLSTTSQ
jgi:hypothetical protein